MAQNLEDLGELPFIGDFRHYELEAMLLEEDPKPVMEPLQQETAMAGALEHLMDSSNVGDLFTKNIDIEGAEEGLRSFTILNKGRNRFLHFVDTMTTASKNLWLQRRYEDDDDVIESLLFLQNRTEEEIARVEKVGRASKKQV